MVQGAIDEPAGEPHGVIGGGGVVDVGVDGKRAFNGFGHVIAEMRHTGVKRRGQLQLYPFAVLLFTQNDEKGKNNTSFS